MSNIIEVKELKKSFSSPQGPIEVLKGISFSVAKGESVSIRGESGAGKTTLLYLMSLLEKPDVGTIIWEDTSIKAENWTQYTKRRGYFMGFIFQSYYLIPELNALENVMMGKRLLGRTTSTNQQRAQDLLEKVGLKNRLKSLPNQLSGGERQRVALARALIHQPQLILADEPTGNLDEDTGKEVMDLLIKLCEEESRSLVLVTHNPEFAKRTGRQLVLHRHKIEEA